MTKQRNLSGEGTIFRISVMSGVLSQIFSTLSGSRVGISYEVRNYAECNPFSIRTPLRNRPDFPGLSAIGYVRNKKAHGKERGCAYAPIHRLRNSTDLRNTSIYISLPGCYSCFSATFFCQRFLPVNCRQCMDWVDIKPISLRVRARFFSALSQYVMLTAIAVSYGFSFFIDHFSMRGEQYFQQSTFFTSEHLPIGFTIIFSVSCCRRFIGFGCTFTPSGKEKED